MESRNSGTVRGGNPASACRKPTPENNTRRLPSRVANMWGTRGTTAYRTTNPREATGMWSPYLTPGCGLRTFGLGLVTSVPGIDLMWLIDKI